MSFEGNNLQEMANGQDIGNSVKNGPRPSAPLLPGLFSIIFKHVYWYIQQISGERLQDHWYLSFLSIITEQNHLNP